MENIDEFYKTIGKNIKKVRLNAHETQEEFAEKIGISFNYVGMIERGLRVPKLETFIKIANVLGVTPDYLLADYITAKEDKQNAELNERIERLSESDRKHILEVIDLLIKQTGNE